MRQAEQDEFFAMVSARAAAFGATTKRRGRTPVSVVSAPPVPYDSKKLGGACVLLATTVGNLLTPLLSVSPDVFENCLAAIGDLIRSTAQRNIEGRHS